MNQSLRISTMSAIAGVSASHFFGLFKSTTGFTPMGYFIRLRMRYASELLRDRTLSVKQIAALLGYDDPCYFSRVFKKITGLAPRKYREMIADSADQPGSWPTDSGKESVDPLPFLRAVPPPAFPHQGGDGEPGRGHLQPIAAASF